MKKMICILITVMIIVSALSFGVSAQATVTPDPNNLFEEAFIEQYKDSIRLVYEYDELYYHYDNEGNIDWVYIKAIISDPSVAYSYAVYGDMVCLLGSVEPFGDYYGVYDVAQDEFISACKIDDLSAYDGLEQQVYKREFLKPIGDFDQDGKLTIIDATGIQYALAGLADFPYNDDLEEMWYFKVGKELKYFTDFDRDGKRTVMDATAIQYKLAGLEY